MCYCWFGDVQIASPDVIKDANYIVGRECAWEHVWHAVTAASVFHQELLVTGKNVASATPIWPLTATKASVLEILAYIYHYFDGYIILPSSVISMRRGWRKQLVFQCP